jgi:hypothetical protein
MIYINLGRREQGKTTLALYLAQRSEAALQVIFDPRGLFPTDKRATTAGVIDEQFGEAEKQLRSRIVVTPEYDLQVRFEQTCREVKTWVQNIMSNVALIIDEARMLDLQDGAFDWLARCASRSQLTIILTAHRPKDIPVDVRAIADVWCVFPTTQAHDFEVFEDQFNEPACNAIRRLKDRQFLAWDDTSASYKTYSDPALWYVPLAGAGATPLRRDLLEGGTEPQKDLLS